MSGIIPDSVNVVLSLDKPTEDYLTRLAFMAAAAACIVVAFIYFLKR